MRESAPRIPPPTVYWHDASARKHDNYRRHRKTRSFARDTQAYDIALYLIRQILTQRPTSPCSPLHKQPHRPFALYILRYIGMYTAITAPAKTPRKAGRAVESGQFEAVDPMIASVTTRPALHSLSSLLYESTLAQIFRSSKSSPKISRRVFFSSPRTQNPLPLTEQRVKVVAQTGIEPVTQGFSVLCSTN
jgi:hypothetical protein